MSIGFILLMLIVFVGVGALITAIPDGTPIKRIAIILVVVIFALFCLDVFGQLTGLYSMPLHFGK